MDTCLYYIPHGTFGSELYAIRIWRSSRISEKYGIPEFLEFSPDSFFFFFNPLFGCSYNLSIWSLEDKKVRIFRITCLLKLGIKAGLEFEGCLRFCSCWETLEILGTLFFFFYGKEQTTVTCGWRTAFTRTRFTICRSSFSQSLWSCC